MYYRFMRPRHRLYTSAAAGPVYPSFPLSAIATADMQAYAAYERALDLAEATARDVTPNTALATAAAVREVAETTDRAADAAWNLVLTKKAEEPLKTSELFGIVLRARESANNARRSALYLETLASNPNTVPEILIRETKNAATSGAGIAVTAIEALKAAEIKLST